MTGVCSHHDGRVWGGGSTPARGRKTSNTIDLLLTSSAKLLSCAITMAVAPVLQLKKICRESYDLEEISSAQRMQKLCARLERQHRQGSTGFGFWALSLTSTVARTTCILSLENSDSVLGMRLPGLRGDIWTSCSTTDIASLSPTSDIARSIRFPPLPFDSRQPSLPSYTALQLKLFSLSRSTSSIRLFSQGVSVW